MATSRTASRASTAARTQIISALKDDHKRVKKAYRDFQKLDVEDDPALERQREAEAELLFVGDQYRKALASYYYATPSAAKVLPERLEDLLQDSRFPMPVRHLRRAYLDPITSRPFKLLRSGAQIVGVASVSDKPTIKRGGFKWPYHVFEQTDAYSQWEFVFRSPSPGRPQPDPTKGRSPGSGIQP